MGTQSAVEQAPLHDAPEDPRHTAYFHLVENYDDADRREATTHIEDRPAATSRAPKTQFRLSERLIFASASNRPMSRASLARAPKRNSLTARPKRAAKVAVRKKVAKRFVRLAIVN